MATRPPGPPGPPGAGLSPGAAPIGAVAPAGPGPAGPGPAGPAPGGAPGGPGAPGGGGGPQEIMKGIINIGKQIEQSLIMFAQAMPEGARYFQQANELIQQGIAVEIAAAAQESEQAPASAPTEAGRPFPGGGLGSAARP